MITAAKTMKAVQINSYGGNNVVKNVADAARPSVSPDRIVVEIYAAGINPVDWKIREGYFADRIPLQFPITLGGDFSGVIIEQGENIFSGLNVGDEVYGQAGVVRSGSGTFAEYALASMKYISGKPKNISHVEAAALPLVGISASQALFEHINLKKDQKILIHGGAGGIGSIAIQLAKYAGAEVYTTVRDADARFVKGLGADYVIDYTSQKFEDILSGLDAVFDTVGGETYARSFPVLRKGGVIVSMLEQPNKDLMSKYRVTAISQFTQVTSGRLEELARMIEQETIKIHIDKVFSLDEASDALNYLQTGHPKGKVVLKIK